MKLIKIIAQLNPFTTDKSIFEFESDTVSNILRKIDTNKAVNTGWRVMIDDQIITDFETVVPENATVYVKLVPEGDSPEETEAKAGVWVGFTAMVAGIVLLFIPGAQVMGGVLLGMGVMSFTAAGYTYLDIQAQKLADREKPEADPSIRGSQNQSRPMQQIPTLLGRRRIYPDLIMTPYTEVDSSGNQYLCQLFCAGQKDQKIETSSIKIEETLLKDYSASKNIDKVLAGTDEHIKMKIHYGDSSLSLFKKCVHEQQFNSSLKNKLEDDTSGAVIWTSPAGTTEINVDIFFYNGLVKYNDKGETQSTSVTVKAYYKQKDASDSAYQLIGYFKNGSNTISDSQLKTLRYVVSKSGLKADSYTIKVERETADSDSSMVVDEVYLGSIRAIKNTSPVRSEILQKLCIVELKVKSTPKLQNIIEKLNFVSQSYLPIYSKSGTGANSWTTKALSSNPASVAIFAMQGAVAQQKLKDSDIDWLAFEKLYTWCESHEYECNYFLSENTSISQLLTNIAICARCDIFRFNGKITVVQDIERDSAVQLFTPRNSKNYTETLLKNDIPDCIALKFVNEDTGFAEDEVNIYNTSTGNKITEPETTQEVSLWGVTNSKQARKVGMYDLAVLRARSVVHTFQCDFEYMLCSKGDWIKYAGDIALAGLKQGRIENLIYNDNGKIIGFKSDELLPMQEENSYAVRIRKNDGTISLYDVVFTEGNHLEVLFSESLQAGEIQEQNLFAFGIRGQETIDLIVTSISCKDNLMAEITAVEYAPAIFEVDSPNFTLPNFESNISDIPSVVDSGAVDLSDWKTFYTYNDSSEKPAKPTGNGTDENGWHRNSTAQSKWMSSKTSKDVNSGEWSAPSPTGGYVYDQILSEEPKIQNPDAPEFVTAYAEENGIRISCSTKEGIKNSISKYIFEINKGSVWAQKTSESSEFFYVFDRNSDGYPEGIDFSKWRIRAKVQSVYGKESDYTSEITVNTDNYGTWKVQSPEVTVSGNKRFVSLNLSQPKRSDKKEIYGSVGYQILVNRPDLDGEEFFQPATNLDPQANELNYKTELKIPVVCSSNYMQEMPLKGQNAKKWKFKYYEKTTASDKTKKDSVTYLNNIESVIIPDNAEVQYENGILISASWSTTAESLTQFYEYSLVDMPSPESTYYRFKIVAQNLISQKISNEIIIGVFAKANSASDLVDNAITQNALADDAVTANKIAAGTITAEQIAAEDILVKGARAGMVSTEGLQVDDAGFFASKPFVYNYHDCETGSEKSYITKSGEFFVGNSPNVNDERDEAEFLHFIKNDGQNYGGFWLKIKNFILKGLSTIIQGVFMIKNNGTENKNAFLIANATNEIEEETLTASKTLKINGSSVINDIFCDNLFLGKPLLSSVQAIQNPISWDSKFFYFENRILFLDDSRKKLYECDSSFKNIKLIKTFDWKKEIIIVKDQTIIALGGEYFNFSTEIKEPIAISYDNGGTWTYPETEILPISGALEINNRIIFWNRSRDFVYHVFLTDNLFESYTEILTLTENLVSFIKTDSNILYVGTLYKLYKSEDLGNSFLEISLSLALSINNVLGDTLVGVRNGYNYIYVKRPADDDFVLLSKTYLNFKRDNNILVAIHDDKITTFDGENLVENTFLSDILIGRIVALTDSKYLLYTRAGEVVSSDKFESLIPIISDDNTTELNTWSAQKISEKFEKYFPVGIIIAFAIDVNPEKEIGGFWVRISDVFLLGAGNKYGGGDIGGSETITLTENELPEHSHNIEHSHRVESSDKNSSWYRYSASSTNKLNVNSSTGAPFSSFAIPYGTTTSISTTNSKTTGQGKAFSILPPYLGVYYWKRVKVKYRLSFDANGGIGEMFSILEEPKTVVIPTNNFIREGYNFISFNTEPDGSGTTYAPGESLVLSEDITLYAIWELAVSIPAGTYSPSAFKNLISQFITKNGNRSVKSEFTATVNNQTITVPANATIYYNASYSGIEQIGFNSTSYTTIGDNFETFKHYIIYADKTLSYMQNYVNYPITIGNIIFN